MPEKLIAERLWVPVSAKALLWDMDGVLLDSLGLDLTLANQLIHEYIDKDVTLPKGFIRSIFAYHPPEFWRLIFEFLKSEYRVSENLLEKNFEKILQSYTRTRNNSLFKTLPGIKEILKDSKKRDLKLAVVSNNPTSDIQTILSNAGILDNFDLVAGNDIGDLGKKPEPDIYIYAADSLGVEPKQCVVIEDSLIGAEAGYRAHCFTIGVATGGADFETLNDSEWTHRVYSSFDLPAITLRFKDVREKSLDTPNDFVSHMLEHIAWRMGCGIDLYWNNNDWFILGKSLGMKINEFESKGSAGVALGMIDDGSAEVLIELSCEPDLDFLTVYGIGLDWFLSLRCEQIPAGRPLVEILRGLASGLCSRIVIRVCSVEDPHHTWEGIFRSVGMALGQLYAPPVSETNVPDGPDSMMPLSKGPICDKSHKEPPLEIRPIGLITGESSFYSARVTRNTAESSVSVCVDFSKKCPSNFSFSLLPSLNLKGIDDMLKTFADNAGFSLSVDFRAISLNSTHVVLEDIGLTLGIALKEILVQRMTEYGVMGAGSSIKTVDEFENQPIRVGVSIEGRKFWKIVCFEEPYDVFKKRFIIGQDVFGGLFSEDLDDFIDGLSGGLGCSIMIHVKKMTKPDDGWMTIFVNLGRAVKDAFSVNPYRKGVPSGVKATLF